ncbi:ATP-binding cassette subfamily B protein [Paenibacillus cellulosilyticus]|uniref:ATP-binding cassette subfamily B protein n=1 Tax=Paenibacillus cellulosilyticus TaxID=375489 RepID=A0A2V2YX32_9BACL|nr:ABC transporter ATP-binding protein [Paenibacillus cellulosilyticus]PWV95920.1 ATP-binding cassette subfamily B protein [Paenibacillus cellulosilyticus]QKS47783.1 ABC transporter ATP-binding protein [Paenibacillus cellulosilyticus]
MSIFRKLKPFYWNERMLMLISIIALIGTTVLSLTYTKLLQIFIDEVIVQSKYDLLWLLTTATAAVIMVKSAMQYIYGFLGARVGNRMVMRLRNACYSKLQYQSYSYYDTAKTGDLIARMTVDLDAVRNFIGFDFAQFVNMGLMIGFGAVMMLSMSWKLALLTLMTTPILIALTFRLDRQAQPAYRETRAAMSRISSIAQQNIVAMQTVKSFNRERYEIEQFSQHNNRYQEKQYEASRIVSNHYPLIEWMANLCPILLLIGGGVQVIHGSLTVGELAALFGLTWLIISPMWWIAFHINKFSQAKASGERILELLEQEHGRKSHKSYPSETTNLPIAGEISFKDVTFYYNEQSTSASLSNLTINISPGSVVGIIGPTGSGKSTILKLLIGAYGVREGQIMIDGTPFEDWISSERRGRIAPVFQETYLFAATIRDNIAYGVDNPTEEEIVEAATKAQAHEFISTLPMGYDTVIGERGTGLSGGQKQRISIARALIRKPKILILDNATSALDMETEVKLQKALKSERKQFTCIMMSNKISSIKDADVIIVLDKGSIVQRGSHNELIVAEGAYRNLYMSQYEEYPREEAVSVVGGDRG